jgi:hypothetical protein
MARDYLDEICEQLSGQVEEIMHTKLSKKTTKIQRENIDKVVYEVYEPSFYVRRRMKDGGLRWGARSEMVRPPNRFTSVMSVHNVAKANMLYKKSTFKDLPYLIEYGHDIGGEYDYPNNRDDTGGKYTKPRPFMHETYKEIMNKNLLNNTLKYGLRRLGYQVK